MDSLVLTNVLLVLVSILLIAIFLKCWDMQSNLSLISKEKRIEEARENIKQYLSPEQRIDFDDHCNNKK